MPAWLHSRAEHILAKNPSMPKSEAFAIASQQSHALGKTPKGYGTAKGKRVAKAKYDTPKDDEKKANPGGLDSPKMAAMCEELIEKLALSPLAIGALGGAGIGALTAEKGHRMRGAALGGAVGGLAGAAYKGLAPAAGSAGQAATRVPTTPAGVTPAAPAWAHPAPPAPVAKARQLVSQEPSVVLGQPTGKPIAPAPVAKPAPVPPQQGPMATALGPKGYKPLTGGGARPVPEAPTKRQGFTPGAPAQFGSGQPSTPLSQMAHSTSMAPTLTAPTSSITRGANPTRQFAPSGMRERTLASPGNTAAAVGSEAATRAGQPVARLRPAKGALRANRPETQPTANFDINTGKPLQMPSVEATEREGGDIARAVHQFLPSEVQKGIASKITPEMASLGMTPEAALQVMGMGAHRGEDYMKAVKRQALQKSAAMFRKLASLYLKEQIGKSKLKPISAAAPDSRFAVKQAFQTSEYAGPDMSIGPVQPKAPYMGPPPVRYKTAGPPSEKRAYDSMTDELMKLNAMHSPMSQLSGSQKVGLPKSTGAPGPSIQQQSKPVGYGTALSGATKEAKEKKALIERLVRLGATDIPGTPRLLMKQRSPHELGVLQHDVEKWWNTKVTDPIMNVAEKGIKKLPTKAQDKVRKVARLGAEDPVGTVATQLIPVPGAHPAYVAGKKALERGIDRVFPLPQSA